MVMLCLISEPFQLAKASEEYQLKVAYIYNFLRLINWPESTLNADDSTMDVCVYRYNPFGSNLMKLESKKIDNHPIKVHLLQTPEQGPCHLVFLPSGTSIEPELLESFAASTLLIGETNGFIENGGDIEFILMDPHLKFRINNTSLKEKGFQPRASLLELAIEVR